MLNSPIFIPELRFLIDLISWIGFCAKNSDFGAYQDSLTEYMWVQLGTV